MTMRLDIVTNDAGELVRREHARELGAGVVVAVYRLAKLAMMHDLGNQAFTRQLEHCHQIIGEYCLRSGSNVNVLFALKATFVAGQLLKGNRGAYEAATELGELFEKLGGSELLIAREVTREDLFALAEQISAFHRTGVTTNFQLPATISLRQVSDSARLRGIELEDLSPDQRIVRAYASAVVIMRRFFEDLETSRYILPRRIKRIAQSLVDLSDARAAAFLGVTEARNANHDAAGRAVNTAILAVSLARETTSDRASLAQIAMAAMMHDVARPRALALAQSAGASEMAGPTVLSEDQEDRLAAGAAAVLTALGRVNEPSITRTVVTFEALWLRRKTWLGEVYWGARPPTLHATIISVARRYNDLVTPEPGLPPPTTDFAVATLANELTDAQDRTVLRMLVSALGLLPTGTLVQLSTNEVAEVVRGARGIGDKPRIKIVKDANGAAMNLEVELADDPRRTVTRVLGVDGWKQQALAPPPGEFDEDDVPATTKEDPSNVSGERSGASMGSLGSSPSAVAQAMGRVLAEEAPKESLRPERTVFQPHGPNSEPAETQREAAARGNLSATPLPHVLVYMLDHALTGSVVFEGTNQSGHEGVDHTIYFVRGVPAKIRLGETVALLGEVLVEAGSIARDAVEQAAAGASELGIMLGESLVGHDLISRDQLDWALETQLMRKAAHVANLPPEIQYAYYRDVDLLETWGDEVVMAHPLNPILASVRNWHDRARVRATLSRIGAHTLAFHPDSDLVNLATTPEEQIVLDAMRAETLPLPALFQKKLAEDEVVSSLVYSLAVTRQFAFKGQKKGPMAARGAAWRSQAPGRAGMKSSGPFMAPGAPRQAVPLAPAALAASAGAPPPRIGPSSAKMRAAAPASVPGARPQIRIQKKASVAAMPAVNPNGPPSAPPSSEDDNAKTIARAAPARPVPAPRAAAAPPLAAPVPSPEASIDIEIDMDGPGAEGPDDLEAALEAMASFRLAEGALQRNDLEAAQAHAQKAVAGDPEQADYVILLAWIKAQSPNADQAVSEAIRTMSKVLIQDPSNERALLYRGRLLVKTNRLHEALNDFNELLLANPHHREAQNEARQLKSRVS